MKYIPNILTVLRVIAAFILAPLILMQEFSIALVVYVFASLTDFFDGFLARKYKVTSKLGSILDPLADKLMIIISYSLLAFINIVPMYLAIIVILRDTFILAVVGICFFKNIQLKFTPLFISKINTTFQLIFIILVLGGKSFCIEFQYIINLLSFIVATFTITSFIEYVYKYYWIRNEFKKR